MDNTVQKSRKHDVTHDVEPLMIRAEQAAVLCGVSLRQWHSMRAAGQCPPSIKIGGCRLWRLDVIRRWVEMNCPSIDKFEAISRARSV